MATPVTLKLRTDAKTVTGADVDWIFARPDTVDLDTLTPRARALAEAVAQMPGGDKGAGEILCTHRTLTRGQAVTNPEVWLTEEQMAEPARMTWAVWDKYPANSTTAASDYLERQARKIPSDWAIVSAWGPLLRPEPVPTAEAAAADDRLTAQGVVDRLARLYGRRIGPGTWRSYASRGQMQVPAPVAHAGRTPLWDPADVDAWATRK